MKSIDFHKLNKWVEKLLSYPGINREDLIQKKRYWIASISCLLVSVTLITTFWIFKPEFIILISYGLFQVIMYLIFIIASIIIPRNIRKTMLYSLTIIIVVTFLFVLKLGGIMHSGGLIFVGLFMALFTLDIHGKKDIIWLFGIYVVTLILAGVLQPYLTVAPEITPNVNLIMFIFNLLWVSVFTFIFMMNFMSHCVSIEKKETKRLIKSDKRKTKQYAYIAHEFRTPLTVIRGMSDLVKNEPQKWLHKGTMKIDKNVDYLINLVDKMLNLSKLEAGVMSINKIQGDVILYLKYITESFHSSSANKRITLKFLPETDMLILDYDADKLMHILYNLISNAIKYTQSGGQVSIITLVKGIDEKKFVIKVIDNGIGIRKDHIHHIFDRFFRATCVGNKAKYLSGSGLGLAVTSEMIKLLKGTISVKSIYNKGAEFTVSLPFTNNAPLLKKGELPEFVGEVLSINNFSEDKRPVPNVSVSENKPLLLIVEDSIDVTDYLLAILKTDYKIVLAYNGKEGWSKALKILPDIILSDIMMPEMDGIELLHKLKNDIHTSHIPVIILTAKADVISRLKGLKTGADAYIAKPFNKEELLIQLNKLIELRNKLQERYADIRMQLGTDDKKYSIEDSFIYTVQQYMLKNLYDEDFNVKELCYEVAMGRTQLYSKFKSLTNRTIFEYYQSLRLHKAKELLMESDTNVSEVAFSIGYKHLSHFSMAFTKEFGVNPSKINDQALPS